MKAPIAIMSFNRPDYLVEVLDSLLRQIPETLAGRAVHLFQDGAVNRYSRLRYAQDAEIQACVALFCQKFPHGIVHASPDNIGIHENFVRAEDTLFGASGTDCAYFFEDDMVLSPFYLRMMEQLEHHARASGRVAYFAAYGDYYATPEANERRRREVITLDHVWGFGLLRQHWHAIRQQFSGYHALVAGSDYNRRDTAAILDLYAYAGGGPLVSSQDAAKSYASAKLGLWRARTVMPFARYIGARGVHMNPATFDRLGFARTVMAEAPVDDLQFPDAARIDELVRAEQTQFAQRFRAEFAARREAAPPRLFDPMRPATEDDARAIIRLLLHREAWRDERQLGEVDRTPVPLMLSGVMQGEEYISLMDRLHDQLVSTPASGTARLLVNVALGKSASQSSMSEWSRPNDPQGAVNGVKSGGHGFHTQEEDNPWWQVDLGAPYTVQEIVVYNRADPLAWRARTMTASVAADAAGPWREIYAGYNIFGGIADNRPLRLRLDCLPDVRFVRFALRERNFFHLDEVEVYALV